MSIYFTTKQLIGGLLLLATLQTMRSSWGIEALRWYAYAGWLLAFFFYLK